MKDVKIKRVEIGDPLSHEAWRGVAAVAISRLGGRIVLTEADCRTLGGLIWLAPDGQGGIVVSTLPVPVPGDAEAN